MTVFLVYSSDGSQATTLEGVFGSKVSAIASIDPELYRPSTLEDVGGDFLPDHWLSQSRRGVRMPGGCWIEEHEIAP